MALWRYGVMALWRYGVMATPALAFDEEVVSSGKVLTVDEVKGLLKEKLGDK
ncbi:thioredoxin family protein [Streptococcus ictaluri]|nr:thioredoxin family protein [Streptococcus ictaluri]